MSGIGDDLSDLTAALNPPARQSVNVSNIADSATALLSTLSPLAELLTAGAANQAAMGALFSAPAGTPENAANQVLANTHASNLPGALSNVNRIAAAATQLIDTGHTSLASSSPEVATLGATAAALGKNPQKSTPRPIGLQRTAAQLISHIPALKTTEHSGQICDVLDRAGIDTTRWTGRDIARELTTDTQTRGWVCPHNSHDRLRSCAGDSPRLIGQRLPLQNVPVKTIGLDWPNKPHAGGRCVSGIHTSPMLTLAPRSCSTYGSNSR